MSRRPCYASIKHHLKPDIWQEMNMDWCAPIMPTSVDKVMSATTGLCAVWVLTMTLTPCQQYGHAKG